MRFNETFFFETEILLYLYKKHTVSTKDIEDIFGNPASDKQHVNNVISNKDRRTSFIHKNYMEYDSVKQTLAITKKGASFVGKIFSKRRHS